MPLPMPMFREEVKEAKPSPPRVANWDEDVDEANSNVI